MEQKQKSRVELAAELAACREQLTEQNRLIKSVSHDLNNKLSVIMGSAEIIRLNVENDRRLFDLAGNIVECADKSARLVEELAGCIKKAEKGISLVDVHSILDDIRSHLISAENRTIHIDSRHQAVSSMVMGDPIQLKGAFISIARQVCRCTGPQNRIQVQTQVSCLQKEQECINLGLKPGRYVKIVFDTDYPLSEMIGHDGATIEDLQRVYAIVSDHGGTIRHGNHSGISHELYLPCIDQRQADNIPLIGSERALRILVVDDEESVLSVIGNMVCQLGHRALPFSRGDDAVRIYANSWREIDLVILDMIMPGMNGKQVYENLYKSNNSVKVLFASGHFSNGDPSPPPIDNIHTRMIKKPFQIQELDCLIKEMSA